jgi:hypothetical protein
MAWWLQNHFLYIIIGAVLTYWLIRLAVSNGVKAALKAAGLWQHNPDEPE